MTIVEPKLDRNKDLKGKSVEYLAGQRGKDPLDAFLDLMVEESLDTVFVLTEINVDPAAVSELLLPVHRVGLSDGGAHVQVSTAV